MFDIAEEWFWSEKNFPHFWTFKKAWIFSAFRDLGSELDQSLPFTGKKTQARALMWVTQGHRHCSGKKQKWKSQINDMKILGHLKNELVNMYVECLLCAKLNLLTLRFNFHNHLMIVVGRYYYFYFTDMEVIHRGFL